MDQLNIPFGLFYNILTCFDRRELCQLRNVNRRHYTVIENKFGTTPYLVFKGQRLHTLCWKWWPASEVSRDIMPIHARKQLRTSKFVRFKLTELVVCHVWENQKLSFDCVSNYTWNEEWAYMVAKAKYLEVGHGSISFLRQLISCNCVHLECDASFYDGSLDDCQLPWGHILEFLFKLNTEGIVIHAKNNTKNHTKHIQGQMLEFLERVKQKFLDSLAKVDFSFVWTGMPRMDWDDGFIFDDFIVHNRRTKQCLRFHSTAYEFKLTVEQCDQKY
ncbi:hypothetical protein DdX_18467 [Ditylenchus destructor]|uniref:F-box domain-containing protein n=1 Tax=Ditylenchus destructor TaxID=166010 RepID=A0AAD4QY49_9BILA|nr:hypothetical protein DdX_18467 [Ditylenchus destructor]